jgi:hypothetical protein
MESNEQKYGKRQILVVDIDVDFRRLASGMNREFNGPLGDAAGNKFCEGGIVVSDRSDRHRPDLGLKALLEVDLGPILLIHFGCILRTKSWTNIKFIDVPFWAFVLLNT